MSLEREIDQIGRKRAILKRASMNMNSHSTRTKMADMLEWYRLVDGEELRYWRGLKVAGEIVFNAHMEFRLASLERIAKSWCDADDALPFDDTCPVPVPVPGSG